MPDDIPEDNEAYPLIHTRKAGRDYLMSADVRADAERGGMDGWPSTAWAVDSYGSAFAPGAWKRSVGQRKRPDGTFNLSVLFQHNADWVIGAPTVLQDRKSAADHPGGLYAETTLFNDGGTSPGTGSVALRQLRDGANFGLSVGFNTVRKRSGTADDPLNFDTAPSFIRSLKHEEITVIEEAAIWEFSIVTFPANPNAIITNVRAERNAEALSYLLDELREGRLDAAGLALVDSLIALRTAPGSPDDVQAPTAPRARRTVLIELAALEAAYGRYGAVA